MGKHCCVINCPIKSHDRRGKRINEGIGFYCIPAWKKKQSKHVSDVTRRRRMAWVAAIRRANITFDQVPRTAVVCSKHFHKGKPAYEMIERDPDWVPSLNLGHSEVKEATVPTVFAWSNAKPDRRKLSRTSRADPVSCGEDIPEDDRASTSSSIEASLLPADHDYDQRTLPPQEQIQEARRTVVFALKPLSVEECAKLTAMRSCSALEGQTSIPTSGPSCSVHTETEGAPLRKPKVQIIEDRHAAQSVDSVTIKLEPPHPTLIECSRAAPSVRQQEETRVWRSTPKSQVLDSEWMREENNLPVLPDPAVEMNEITEQETNGVQCKTEPQVLQIGFIGAGNMAFGIAQGILMSGEVSPENVKVSAPSSNNLGRFQEMGVAVTHANAEVVRGSRLIFLAVKPHLIPVVLQEIGHLVTQEKVIVSVAAGVTIATVEALLPPAAVVLRLMPNLPCVLQEGALLFARGSRALPEHGAFLRSLLSPCGLVEEGPEAWIDAHTGLSGSGVAFVYLFAEALAEGGVKMGMPSALAHRIAAQTVLGAGRLLRDSGKHPAQLRADVCTPGGTTIFGLHALEQGGLRAATMGAVEAATERAKELGRK